MRRISSALASPPADSMRASSSSIWWMSCSNGSALGGIAWRSALRAIYPRSVATAPDFHRPSAACRLNLTLRFLFLTRLGYFLEQTHVADRHQNFVKILGPVFLLFRQHEEDEL